MDLYLKVDEDENYKFFQLYHTLSALRKKIWNKIVQYARKWPKFQTSQSKIAKWCGCSRSAISEAFKLFKEWGWMSLISRGWKKTKTIFIPETKQQIDTVKQEYFKRVEATHRATHTYSIYKNITSRRTGEIEIPQYLRNLNIPIEAKLKLSLVPEYIYQETKYKCQKKAMTGWKPDKEVNYFVGTAINMAIEKGHSINWRTYYASL